MPTVVVSGLVNDAALNGTYSGESYPLSQEGGSNVLWYDEFMPGYLLGDGMTPYYASMDSPPESGAWSGWGPIFGSDPSVTVTVGAGVTKYAVSGTVTDASTDPYPGVTITAMASGKTSVVDVTDASGNYSLDLEDEVTWRLTPTIPAYRLPPVMSGASTPSPYVASAAGEYSTWYAWKGFDGTDSGKWRHDSVSSWLKIDLGAAGPVVTKYKLQAGDSFEGYMPTAWTIEGSNNNSDWTTIDTVTGEGAWDASEVREFTCDSPGTTAFRYYRFSMATGSPIIVGEWYLQFDAVVEDWSPAYIDVPVDGAAVPDQDFGVSAGGETLTATRALRAWGAEGLTLTRSLAAAGAEGLSATRGVETAGAEVLTAVRELLTYGYTAEEILEIAMRAYGLETLAATRAIAAAGAEALAETRDLEATGAEALAAARPMETAGGQALTATRAVEVYGTDTAFGPYQPAPPRGPNWRTVANVSALNRITCACAFDGDYWLGAAASAVDRTRLYRVSGGAVSRLVVPGTELTDDEVVSSLAADADKLYVASGGNLGGVTGIAGLGRTHDWTFDSYDGAQWADHRAGQAQWGIVSNQAASAGGTGPDHLLYHNLLWGTGGMQWRRGDWGNPPAGDTRRLRPAGSILVEQAGRALLCSDEGAVTTFDLPPAATPNTLCWYLGRPWCLRFDAATNRQALCYGDPDTGAWQDVASWPVDTAGCYWYMRPWSGQLLMYGATATLTQAAGNVWLANLNPVRGQWAPPVLSLGQAEPEFTQALTEGAPALALRAATAPRLVVLYPPVTTAYAGEVLYVEPEWAEAGGTIIPRAGAVRAVAQELQRWGGTGWEYAAETPLLEVTSVAEEETLPLLLALYQEWPDGTGDESPELLALRQEWPAEESPLLLALYQEWPDGTGAEEPELLALRQQWSDGYGDAPELLALRQEWAAPSPGPELLALRQEWPSGFSGPAEDELVLVLEPFTPEREPVNAVRVVVPFEARGRVRCCLIRVDTGQAVDDWATYQAFPPLADVLLETPGVVGDQYRVVLIGRGEVPEVAVICNPD